MTLGRVFIRFLKENGAYYDFIKRQPDYIKNKIEQITKDNLTFVRHYLYRKLINEPEDLFLYTCGHLPIFSGRSDSKHRRKFYRLNAKWKKYIKNFRVQHNIDVGDVVKIHGWRVYNYVVDKISNGAFFCHREDNANIKIQITFGSIADDTIFDRHNISKKYMLNVYYNDGIIEKGKIDGDFNEIQL